MQMSEDSALNTILQWNEHFSLVTQEPKKMMEKLKYIVLGNMVGFFPSMGKVFRGILLEVAASQLNCSGSSGIGN